MTDRDANDFLSDGGSISFPASLWKTSFASVYILISIYLIYKFVLQVLFWNSYESCFSHEFKKIFITSSFFICMRVMIISFFFLNYFPTENTFLLLYSWVFDLRTIDILSQIMLCRGAVLCIVGWLEAPPASAHSMLPALPFPTVMTTKNVCWWA